MIRFLAATPDEPTIILRNLLDHDEIGIQGRLTVVTRAARDHLLLG